jgi:hypothetical protein
MNEILGSAMTAKSPTDNWAAAGEMAYLEFVIYTVNDKASFPAIRASAARDMKTAARGHLWWKRLKGENGLYADVVAWASPEEAKAAAAMIEKDPRFQPLISAIKSVVHFGHYWAHQHSDTLSAQLDSAPIVEIALYTVKDRQIHARTHEELYGLLAGRDGLLGGARLSHDGSENGFGDLLAWRDAQAHEATGKAMMGMKELAPFFEGTNESIVFALFSKDHIE